MIRGNRGFEIGAAHFVERHGLVVIIAIGESVVAIGIGASHLAVDGPLVVVALLGLGLSACLWWLYFGTDTEPAEHALGAMPPVRRARAALNAFGYAHIPILLGIVTVAAAERGAFTHPSHELSWARAALLGGGVALYLAGDVLFRLELGIGSVSIRVAAAVLAVAALPLGATVSATAEIAALVIVLVTAVGLETRFQPVEQGGAA